MTELLFYTVAGLLLLGAAAFLLLQRRSAPQGAPPASRYSESVEFFPIHCQFFAQMQHSLSADDDIFLSDRASPALRARWRATRRRAARMFLAGLREDFARLNRLAKTLARLSPKLAAGQEAELLWLNARFHMLCGFALVQITLGRPAATVLRELAALIGGLGSRLEQASLSLQPPSTAVTL
jgi:hypothetical protein